MRPLEEWVPLAEVARPHGVRGELRLRLFNKDSDVLLERDEVLVRMKDGEEHEVSVDRARRADDAILMKLFSVEDRDRADERRGALICAKRADFPPLAVDEFYVCDAAGARVSFEGTSPRDGDRRSQLPERRCARGEGGRWRGGLGDPAGRCLRGVARFRSRCRRAEDARRVGALDGRCGSTSSRCSPRYSPDSSKPVSSGARVPGDGRTRCPAPKRRASSTSGFDRRATSGWAGTRASMIRPTAAAAGWSCGSTSWSRAWRSLDADAPDGARAHRVLLTPQGRPSRPVPRRARNSRRFQR